MAGVGPTPALEGARTHHLPVCHLAVYFLALKTTSMLYMFCRFYVYCLSPPL